MAGITERYPKRGQFFAMKFSRLMVKVCAAQDIGPEAVLLCMIIAQTEDAKRYRGPVTYYNEQLMPLVGIKSKMTFNRVRQRAIDAGWLVYENGGTRRVGTYWVTIPSEFAGTPDGPIDESGDSDWSISDTNPVPIRYQSGTNPVPIRYQSDTPSILRPIPNPLPKEESPLQKNVQVKSESQPMLGQSPEEVEFLDTWRRTPGVSVYTKSELSALRRGQFMARLEDPGWDWRAALAKFPLQCSRDHPEGWKPSIGWFLEMESVEKILEGRYDFSPGGRKAEAKKTGPGVVYESSMKGSDDEPW